jgi:hypothetical protein
MKTAIVILSDPKPASDEATTRLLNALAMANECKRSGDTLEIAFAGTGTRWPEELVKLGHPANALFNDLREHVVGASRSCAARNGATACVEAAGLALIGDNEVPGTPGVLSLRRYYADDWNVAIF